MLCAAIALVFVLPVVVLNWHTLVMIEHCAFENTATSTVDTRQDHRQHRREPDTKEFLRAVAEAAKWKEEAARWKGKAMELQKNEQAGGSQSSEDDVQLLGESPSAPRNEPAPDEVEQKTSGGRRRSSEGKQRDEGTGSDDAPEPKATTAETAGAAYGATGERDTVQAVRVKAMMAKATASATHSVTSIR